MTSIKRVFIVVVLAVALALAYLAVIPSAVDPVQWNPPPLPEMTGPLAPNADLALAEPIAQGHVDGPEDVETDGQGRLLAGTNAGTIVRVEHGKVEVFATTGGRPLGLDFAPNGQLIVADAIKGLLAVSPDGKQIQTLADAAEGVRFGFADDVTVARDGTIYFSDASDKFGFGDHMYDLLEGRPHGRLMQYDPASKTTKVLLADLYFANGVALASDESFVIVSETYRYRLTRYWLQGPKAGSTDVFAEGLPGFPDGVSQSGRGTFWVAMFTVRNRAGDFLAPRPLLKRMVANLPRSLWPKPDPYGLIVEVDEQGEILRSLHDTSGAHVDQVTSVHERDGKLYLGHLHRDRITRIGL
jgi:sugar lactone lactonase YvrE